MYLLQLWRILYTLKHTDEWCVRSNQLTNWLKYIIHQMKCSSLGRSASLFNFCLHSLSDYGSISVSVSVSFRLFVRFCTVLDVLSAFPVAFYFPFCFCSTSVWQACTFSHKFSFLLAFLHKTSRLCLYLCIYVRIYLWHWKWTHSIICAVVNKIFAH